MLLYICPVSGWLNVGYKAILGGFFLVRVQIKCAIVFNSKFKTPAGWKAFDREHCIM